MESTLAELWAALDFGSNSFHLLVARRTPYGFRMVERLKEKVQLMAGYRDGRLADAALDRGIASIGRMAQRIRHVAPERIIAVGTCALRNASNRGTFVDAATQLLGVPVRVVSGEEEAQAIFLGVASATARLSAPRYVIDIGGGSTEFAAGTGERADAACSVDVGCVVVKEAHFLDATGRAVDAGFGYRAAYQHAAEILAEAVLPSVAPDAVVVGTSGTVESVLGVLQANGWAHEYITRDSLAELEAAIESRRWVLDAGIPGLAPERLDIFPAGVAILAAIFDRLSVSSMQYMDTSLLQGVLWGRVSQKEREKLMPDNRARALMEIAAQYSVDLDQAARVRRTAHALAGSISEWGLSADCLSLLDAAAILHEAGKAVHARHYHRHGAYLIRHGEFVGMSADEQTRLALVVRGHRRSLPLLAFGAYPEPQRTSLLRVTIILRLAVILERGHTDAQSPSAVALQESGEGVDKQLVLRLPSGFLEANPLSARELEVEAAQLKGAGLRLVVSGQA